MTVFGRVDVSAYPAPREAYGWRIYLLAFSASLGFAMFGYDVGFIGGSIALPSFKAKFGLDTAGSTALSANIVSTFLAGAFFGPVLVYPSLDRIGRKIGILSAGAIFLLGSILTAVAPHLSYIYAGRALTGVGVGISSLIVPVYIGECSPPALRGRLIGIAEGLLQGFQIVGFWINYGVNRHIPASSSSQWRLPFGFQIVPAVLLLSFMVFQPESPRYLIKKNREAEASKVLAKIRNLPEGHAYITYEIDKVKEQLVAESVATGGDASFVHKLRMLRRPSILRRLLIGFGLMTFLALTGVNSVNYFSPTIIRAIGFKGTNVSLLATGIYGLVKGFFNFIYMIFIIDGYGRRRPLMAGSTVAAFCLFFIAIYSAVSGSFEGNSNLGAGAYASIVMIYIFAVALAMSWTGIPWVYCAEIFPLEVKNLAVSMTTMMQWLIQFAIVYATPYMMRNITYGAFIFFGVMTAISVIWVYFFVPETKGLELEDMETLFGQNGTAATARRKTEEHILARRVGGTQPAGDQDPEKDAASL